jgi:hypothetical protein
MRCKRVIAAFLAAVFLIAFCVPVSAGDGSGRQTLIDPRLADHPWQDENTKGDGEKNNEMLRTVVGPTVVVVGTSIPVLGGMLNTFVSTGKHITPKLLGVKKAK